MYPVSVDESLSTSVNWYQPKSHIFLHCWSFFQIIWEAAHQISHLTVASIVSQELDLWLKWLLQTSHCFLFFCLWQCTGNSPASNESDEAFIGTLAIPALVLPWRDRVGNPTHLPEKDNILRKRSRSEGLWAECSFAVLPSHFLKRLNLAFSEHTMPFNIFSKQFIFLLLSGLNCQSWRRGTNIWKTQAA